MSLIQYKGFSGTATVTEQEFVVNTTSVVLIANDSLVGDLIIAFGDSTSLNNTAILKPGESYRNLPISADSVFVKASTGSVAFRYFGLTGLTANG